MVLDPDLLNAARRSGAALEEADRQALVQRAEYHTAIRRLHLAGAPLREIAEALSLSHQRVQQIVSGAGGTWWRRVWRTRRVRPDAVCTWCERPPSEVAKMIAGPAVYICDGCVREAERAVERDGAPRGPFGKTTGKGGIAGRCAFCRKRAGRDRLLATSPAGHVCSECLRICRGILDGRAA